MSALALDTPRKVRGADLQSFKIKNTTQLYVGSYVAIDSTGYLVPFSGANGQIFVGRLEGGASARASDGTLTLLGDTSGTPIPEGVVNTAPEILEKVAVTGVSTIASVGQPVYLNGTDNATSDLTLTRPTTGSQPLGVIVRYYSSTTCDVLVLPFWAIWALARTGNGKTMIPLGNHAVDFAGNGDLGINIPAPFHGKGITLIAFVTAALTGGPATVTLSIGGVGAGQTLTVTAAAALKTRFAVTLTSGNEFHEGDNLSLIGSTVTAITVGTIEWYLVAEQLPGV